LVSDYAGFIGQFRAFWNMAALNKQDYSGDESVQEIVNYYNGTVVDLEGFATALKGDYSENTVISYTRHLAWLGKDFDPLEENPEPDILEEEVASNFDLSNFLRYAEAKAKQRFGDSREDKRSRDNFVYRTFLSLRKYLEVKGENEKKAELPDSSLIPKPKSKNKTRKLSEAERNSLLQASDDTKVSLSVKVLASGGLRLYELLWLQPTWIDFSDDKAVEIEIPAHRAKGSKYEPEYVFLPTELGEELQEFILERHSCEDKSYQEFLDSLGNDIEEKPIFVFPPNSESLEKWLQKRNSSEYKTIQSERQRFNERLKQLAKNASFNDWADISSHDLRRSFIHDIHQESDLKTAQQYARHSEIQTTAGYVQQKREKLRDNFEDIASG
jgi:site-specific recombinase XerD